MEKEKTKIELNGKTIAGLITGILLLVGSSGFSGYNFNQGDDDYIVTSISEKISDLEKNLKEDIFKIESKIGEITADQLSMHERMARVEALLEVR